MTEPINWHGGIRTLLYACIFENEPSVAQVLRSLSRKRDLFSEFVVAIDLALQSGEDLGALLPDSHSDAVLRKFLPQLRIALNASLHA